ncbi:MAG: hydantoinase/oxoprolinase family protein [Thermomicrobiales bacterium]
MRAGVDIGGTFTDLVVYDDATGEFVVGKTLTTPDDPSRAIESGLLETLAKAEAPIGSVEQLIHGTTLVTNALIERKGAPTALLASEGFRDSLEIGREHRYDLYDLQLEMPRPLVPRELRFGVPGRTLANGKTLEGHDLDEAYLERLAGELRDAGIEAIAIAFLNSYANPDLERRAREVIQRVAPEIRISLSSDVVPEIREYERTSTTVANVYVQARVERYLSDLRERLARIGFDGALFLLISSGALATVETASRYPVRLLESGPAGGALAAAAFGAVSGYDDLLTFDMGGTTAKFAVIDRGEPLLAHGFEVDRRYRFKKGSGLPINLPVIEMIEIGAGGGSIARIDSLGLLKVGPDSAGADPGPVCYGRGGTEPTVTDADLVLGYLDPGFFLGGSMELDIAGAREAIRRVVAEPLGLGIEEAAWGIHQIVNEGMAGAARVHTLERGADPRRLPVFAFGGAGPVHGYRVAAALGSPRLIVPAAAGVMSAIGFLAAPLAFDFVRTFRGRLDALDWARVNELLTEMESEGNAVLRAAGVLAREINHRRIAEMRYVGQGHEVRVPLPPGPLNPASLRTLHQAFEREYLRLYQRLGPPVPLEAITWRVVSTGPKPDLRLATVNGAGGDAVAARKGTRRAYLPEAHAMAEIPVYDRYRLGPGTAFIGPAIVEERESTTVIGPNAAVSIDNEGNLVVDIEGTHGH